MESIQKVSDSEGTVEMEADYERFAICTGEVTEDELKYLLKSGQIVEKDGQYFDVETLTESDFELDLEDSMKENVNPNPISPSEATTSKHKNFGKLDRSCPSSILAQLSITENESSFCDMEPSKNPDFVPSKINSLNQTSTESPFCDMDFSKLNESFVPSSETKMRKKGVKKSSFANMKISKLNESFVPSTTSKLDETTKESSFAKMDISKLNETFVPSIASKLDETTEESSFANMDISKLNESFVPSIFSKLDETTKESSFANMDVSSLNETFVPSTASKLDETTEDSSFANMDISKLNESFVPSTASKLDEITKESSFYKDVNNWKACYNKFKYTKPELPEVLELKETSELSDSQPNTTSTGLNDTFELPDSQPNITSTGLNDTFELPDSQINKTSPGLNDTFEIPESQANITSPGLNDTFELPESQPNITSTGLNDTFELPDSQLHKTATELNNTLNNFGSQEPRLNHTGNENGFSNMNISMLNDSFVPSYAVLQVKETANESSFANLNVSLKSRTSTANTQLNTTGNDNGFSNMNISMLNESFVPSYAVPQNKEAANESSFVNLNVSLKARISTANNTQLNKTGNENGFSNMNISTLNESFILSYAVCQNKEIADKPSFDNLSVQTLNDNLIRSTDGTISDEITEETGSSILHVSELSDSFTSSNGIQPLNQTAKESPFVNMDISKLNESYIPTSGTKLNKSKMKRESSFCGLDTSKLKSGSPLSSSTSARRSKTTRESSLRKAAFESSFSKMNNSKLNESCTINGTHNQTGKVSFSNFDRSRANESLMFAESGTKLSETALDGSVSTDMNASEIVSDLCSKTQSGTLQKSINLIELDSTKSLNLIELDSLYISKTEEHEDTIDLMDQLLAQADELENEDVVKETPAKLTPQRRITPSPSLKSKRLIELQQRGLIFSPTPPRSNVTSPFSSTPVFKTPTSRPKTPRRKSFANVPAKVDSGLRKPTTPCLGLDSPVADYIHSKPVPSPFYRVTGVSKKMMSAEKPMGSKPTGNVSMIPRPSLPTPSGSSKHNAQMFSAPDNKFKQHQYIGPKATLIDNASFVKKHEKENYLAERHTGIREKNSDASIVEGAVIPKKFVQSKLAVPRSYVS